MGGVIKIVQLLLAHGADINAAGSVRLGNVLEAALFQGHHAVAKLLQEHGAVYIDPDEASETSSNSDTYEYGLGMIHGLGTPEGW